MTIKRDEQLLNVFISDTLLRMNGNAMMKGFSYASTAVKCILKNKNVTMMKEVYPCIASVHNSTPTRVERDLRYFIESIWIRGKEAEINKIFGANVYDKQSKPSNNEFIFLIAEIASRYFEFVDGEFKKL